MPRLLSLLVSVFALLGCTERTAYQAPVDAEVGVSPLFTAEQTEVVLAALDSWQTASAGKLHLRVHVGGEGFTTITPARLHGDVGLTTWDHEGPGHAYVQLDVDALGPWLRVCALHEIGHTFGLAHAPAGLMRPMPLDAEQEAAGIDGITLAKFNEYYQ